MTQKKRNVLLTSVVSIALALLICLGCLVLSDNIKAEAQTYSINESLHRQTKIYSRNFSDDYYSLY